MLLHPLPPHRPDTCSRDTATNNEGPPGFVETREHRRFVEFCEACRRYRYIGLCYGRPGVGKTLSARHYSRKNDGQGRKSEPTLINDNSLQQTAFYTASVVNRPSMVDRGIRECREHLRAQALQSLQRERRDRMETVRQGEAQPAVVTGYDRFTGEPITWVRPGYGPVLDEFAAQERAVGDPTTLLVVDEADRLGESSLEQVRAIFDAGEVGLVLLGMPGLEKRWARYPQLYSRIGFVHEFRPLSATEVRQLLAQPWAPPGVCLPDRPFSTEAVATVIRMTGGNFRLLHRLLTQIERVLEVNTLSEVTLEVLEAARESLVMGEA